MSVGVKLIAIDTLLTPYFDNDNLINIYKNDKEEDLKIIYRRRYEKTKKHFNEFIDKLSPSLLSPSIDKEIPTKKKKLEENNIKEETILNPNRRKNAKHKNTNENY